MNNYVYACFELNIPSVKSATVEVKIPFDSDVEAIEYIYNHIDYGFHKKAWLE